MGNGFVAVPKAGTGVRICGYFWQRLHQDGFNWTAPEVSIPDDPRQQNQVLPFLTH